MANVFDFDWVANLSSSKPLPWTVVLPALVILVVIWLLVVDGGGRGWDLHRWQYSNRWASVLAKPLAHGSRLLPPHLLPWHGCGRVVSAGADVGRVLHGHRVV